MSNYHLVGWILFSNVLGFVVGGSVVWASPHYHVAACPNNVAFEVACTAAAVKDDMPAPRIDMAAPLRETIETLPGTARDTLTTAVIASPFVQ